MQHGEFCQTFGHAGFSNSEKCTQNWSSSMKRMLSRQLNLVYNQLNLLEIKCKVKRTNNLLQFHRKIHEWQNQYGYVVASAKELKLSQKQLGAKIPLIIQGHFRLEKRLYNRLGVRLLYSTAIPHLRGEETMFPQQRFRNNVSSFAGALKCSMLSPT